MKCFLYILTSAVVVASATSAHGHGFRIDVNSSNKLVLYSDDPTAGADSIYKVQALLGPSTFKSTDHPGFDVDTFNGPSGFFSGESIRFDVLGPLWFASGIAAPQPAPAGLDLVVSSQDLLIGGSVTVSGGSGFQSGFLIGEFDGSSLGTFEHQLDYAFDRPISVDFPSGVPTGAFALAMRLTGTNGADQPFIPSDPFVAVFNNGLTVSGGNPAFPGVAALLFEAAMPPSVPEPSSFALGVLALLSSAAIAHRKLRCRV